MNMAPVTDPRFGQRLLCCRCRKMKPAITMFADLDGPAFEAFYCTDCAGSHATEQLKRESKED